MSRLGVRFWTSAVLMLVGAFVMPWVSMSLLVSGPDWRQHAISPVSIIAIVLLLRVVPLVIAVICFAIPALLTARGQLSKGLFTVLSVFALVMWVVVQAVPGGMLVIIEPTQVAFPAAILGIGIATLLVPKQRPQPAQPLAQAPAPAPVEV